MERFKKICGIFFALFITLFSLDSFAITCGVNANASGSSCVCTSGMSLLANGIDCVPSGLYNSFNNFYNQCVQRTNGTVTPRVTAYRSPNGTGTIIGYRVTCDNAATNYPSSVNYILNTCQAPGTGGVYNNASPYCAVCSSGAKFDATYAICRKDCSSIANSTLDQSTNTCVCNSGYTMFADTCYPTITLNVNGGTLSSDVDVLYYRTTTPVGLCTDPSVITSNISNATCTMSCVSVSAPTRAGYTFEGWYSGDCQVLGKTGRLSGNSCVSSLDLATITELVAKWEPIEYSINYELNGGSNNAFNPSKYTIETATISLQAPGRAYSTFGGWYKESSFTNKITQIAKGSKGDLTLYAKWTCNSGYTANSDNTACTPNTYTVTFKSGGTQLGTQSFTYGTAKNLTSVANLSGIPVSSQHGWVFVGWSKTPGTYATDAINYNDGASASISANTTLYGVWQRIVTFTYYNGANATSTTTDTENQYYYTAQTGLIALATSITTFDITGEHTNGWNALEWASAKTGAYLNPLAPVVKNVALAIDAPYQYYAVYNRDVRLVYNGNGSTSGTTANTTKTQSFRAGNTDADALTMTLASNGFSRTGYDFNKWAAGSTSGTQYAAGASYTFPNTKWTSGNTANMYATWTAKCNRIGLNANGGTAGGVTELYKLTGSTAWYENEYCEDTISGLSGDELPTKANATFNGYFE